MFDSDGGLQACQVSFPVTHGSEIVVRQGMVGVKMQEFIHIARKNKFERSCVIFFVVWAPLQLFK